MGRSAAAAYSDAALPPMSTSGRYPRRRRSSPVLMKQGIRNPHPRMRQNLSEASRKQLPWLPAADLRPAPRVTGRAAGRAVSQIRMRSRPALVTPCASAARRPAIRCVAGARGRFPSTLSDRGWKGNSAIEIAGMRRRLTPGHTPVRRRSFPLFRRCCSSSIEFPVFPAVEQGTRGTIKRRDMSEAQPVAQRQHGP